MTILFLFISFFIGTVFGYKVGFVHAIASTISLLKKEGWLMEVNKNGRVKIEKLYGDNWYQRRYLEEEEKED